MIPILITTFRVVFGIFFMAYNKRVSLMTLLIDVLF